jgi:hypothetical protein
MASSKPSRSTGQISLCRRPRLLLFTAKPHISTACEYLTPPRVRATFRRNHETCITHIPSNSRVWLRKSKQFASSSTEIFRHPKSPTSQTRRECHFLVFWKLNTFLMVTTELSLGHGLGMRVESMRRPGIVDLKTFENASSKREALPFV